MFSDQQVITGAAIIIAGLSQHCTIVQYHFALVYFLGYMALSTHQMSAVIAHALLLESPCMRFWRGLWILGMYALMIAAVCVFFSDDFLGEYGLLTQCAFDFGGLRWTGFNRAALALMILIYCFGIIDTMRALEFYPPRWVLERYLPFIFVWSRPVLFLIAQADDLLYRFFVFLGERATKSPNWIRRSTWLVLRTIVDSVTVIILTVIESVFSFAFVLLMYYTILLWSSWSIFIIKGAAESRGLQTPENKWGFGQILPMVLIVLPASSAVELFGGMCQEAN